MAANMNTPAQISNDRNPNLETVLARLLPTMGANEYKGASKKRYRGSAEFRGAKMAEGDPVYLNPQFAEAMMGYELDYTLLETPLSRRSRKSSAGQSCRLRMFELCALSGFGGGQAASGVVAQSL